jgi:tRNA pseudouridine13 synthase
MIGGCWLQLLIMDATKPTGNIRTQPEDFWVQEIPAYEPCGDGEHLFIRFRKRGLTTISVVESLARHLGIHSKQAGTAGLKDRHAVTEQWVSFPWPLANPIPEIGAWLAEDVEILEVNRHRNKLRTGHLRGNRFRVVVRGLPIEQQEPIALALHRLEVTGLPNWFGRQRFGRNQDNVAQAISWLRGDAKPPKHPRIRRFHFSAFQSEMFHHVLKRRIEDETWNRILVGDLVTRSESGGWFLCESEAEMVTRQQAGELLVATGPMYGSRMPWPKATIEVLERAVFDEFIGDFEFLKRWSSLGEGTRRPLCLRPQGVQTTILPESPGSICVEFVLPKGAFATSVLGEVMQLHDVTLSSPEAAVTDTTEETTTPLEEESV